MLEKIIKIDFENNRNYYIAAAALLILAISARLPQFISGSLVPNGDESLTGIMALHMLNGKGLPLFMYGQCYGLSFLETGTAALFFRLLGTSGLTLKTAMLSYWCIGWIFFVAASRAWHGRSASLFAGLLLSVMPAWGAYSMYARGGYLTAFVFTGLLFLLAKSALDSRSAGTSIAWSALMGICLSFILFAQALWLPAAAAALAVIWITSSRNYLLPVSALLSGSAVTVIILLGRSACTAWWEPPVFSYFDLFRGALSLPGRITTMFSGSYIYHKTFSLGAWSYAAGIMYGLLTAGFIIYISRESISGRRWNQGTAWGFAILISASATLFLNYEFFGCRFILPVAGYFPLLAAAFYQHYSAGRDGAGRRVLILLMIIIPVSLAGMYQFRNFTFDGKVQVSGISETTALKGLMEEMELHNVKHIYVYDPMPVFHWQIMFLSNEKIIARWFSADDRIPEYPEQVDAALVKGEPVAVAGKREQLNKFMETLGISKNHPRLTLVHNRYFIFREPEIVQLIKLGFSFNR